MSKVFAVTSGKGGVGKSTVSFGLSVSFAKLGKKVLLIDMDEGLRCLDVMLGLDDSVVFDLGDALSGEDIEKSIYHSPKYDNLHLIPAPQNLGTINPKSLEIFAEKIKYFYDIIIFDFPAGIDFSLYTHLPKGTLFLTVALPDPVSLRDASVVATKLQEIGAESRLIINCFDYRLTKKKIYKSIDDIIDQSGLRLLGIIPRSKDLNLLSIKHSLKPKGNAMSAFTRLSRRLLGEHILLPSLKKI